MRAKIQWTDENTRYYGPDAGIGGEIVESEFFEINKEERDEGEAKEEEEEEEEAEEEEEEKEEEEEEEKEEEERNKDGITGSGEEANDASYLNDRQGENESEIVTAAAESKPHDDDNASPKDQTRVQATTSPEPPKRATLHNTQTTIYVGEYSTLVGARKVHLALARSTVPPAKKKIGVLNFASAKKPGGGFINGSQAQVRF